MSHRQPLAGLLVVLIGAALASPDAALTLRATYDRAAYQEQRIPAFRAATDVVRVDVSVRQGTCGGDNVMAATRAGTAVADAQACVCGLHALPTVGQGWTHPS